MNMQQIEAIAAEFGVDTKDIHIDAIRDAIACRRPDICDYEETIRSECRAAQSRAKLASDIATNKARDYLRMRRP